MIEKQLYYLMMVAGYLAVFIMGSIIIVWVLSLGGCSINPLTLQAVPDRGIDIAPYCCTPDEEFPHSCDGFRLCEFNSEGELL